MKRYLSIASLALVVAGMTACGAKETTYELNKEQTKLEWEASFVGDGHAHMGTIDLTEGTVVYADDAFKSGEFTVDMNTISTTDLSGEEKEKLDGHLKNASKDPEADFFDSHQFPKTKVTIKEVNNSGMKVEIAVMGKNIEATVPVKLQRTENKVTAKGTFKVDFSEAGVKGFKEDPKYPKMYVNPVLNFKINLEMNAK